MTWLVSTLGVAHLFREGRKDSRCGAKSGPEWRIAKKNDRVCWKCRRWAGVTP